MAKQNEEKQKQIGERWIAPIADLAKAWNAACKKAFSKENVKAIQSIDANADAKEQMQAWLPMLALLSIVKRPAKNRHAFSYASLVDAIVHASEGRLRKADLDQALEAFLKEDGEIATLAKTEFWTSKKKSKK